MTVTPWLANYPFSDPIFQNFNVQQYLTVSGVNTVQTYDVKDPDADEKPAEEKSEAAPKAAKAATKAAPKDKAESVPETVEAPSKTEDK